MPVSRLFRAVAGRLLGAALLAGTFSSFSPVSAQSVPAVSVGMNTAHTNAVTTGTLAPPLRQRWALTLDGRASAPLIVGGRVYVLISGTSGLKLRAIDSISGATVWEMGVSSERWGALAYDANTVVVQAMDGQLRAYDIANGTLKWTAYTSYIADAPPVARDGRVYVGAGNALKCFNIATGQLVWSKSVRGSSRSAPVIDDEGALYVAYSCPQVYKFDANGTQIWRYGSDGCSGGGGSTASLYDGRLYVREWKYSDTGMREGFVFDAATGADVGSINSHGLPAFFGNQVFTVFRGNSVGNGRINAVSTQTGTENWNWTDGGNLSSPIVLNGRVYVGSSLGKLYALDPQNGGLLWTASVGAPVVTDSDYNNSSPYVGLAAGEDLLVVPAQNQLQAFEAFGGSDTTAPSGYVTSLTTQDFVRAFPANVAGVASDTPGGTGVDRVEMGVYRQVGTPGTSGSLPREYYTGQSYSPRWASNPVYFSTLFANGNWSIDTRYFDYYFESGTYFLEVVTYDRAGNRGVKSAMLRIDKSAPVLTITSPGRPTNSFSSISGTVSDASGSGVASVKVTLLRDDGCNFYSDCGAYWNGTAWIPTSSVTTAPLLDCTVSNGIWAVTSPLPSPDSMPEKWYKLRPVATDRVGNSTDLNLTWNTYSFWLDKTPPKLVFGALSPAPNAAGWNNSAVSIPYTTSDEVRVASATPGSPLVFPNSGKNRTQTVTVTDGAGNVATFVSPAVNIDMLTPVTDFAATGTGPVTVTLSAADRPVTTVSSGIDATFYTINGGEAQTYTAPFSIENVGTHTIRFWSRDVAGNVEAAQTQTVVIAGPNTAPSATSTSYPAGDEDTAQTLVLAATDAENDALTYTIVSPPTKGTLSGTAPNLTYTPRLNLNGADSFTWKVSDGTLESAIATATLTISPVNDAPDAISATISATEDTPKAFRIPVRDLDSDILTYSIVTPPTQGTFSGTAPDLTYTPNAHYNGTDSFTFTVSDGALSDTATATFSIASVNDAPTASAQTLETDEDSAKSLVLGGADVDGDNLTYTVTTPPTNGTLSGTAPNLTYTPNANISGADSFAYKTSDGTLESGAATISISIAAKNDAPVASAQSVSTSEEVAQTIVLSATDIDGDALTFTIETPPTHGTLSGTAPNLTYTPDANYNGADSFTFKAKDATLESAAATVTIGISAVSDAPIAVSDTFTATEDTTLTIAAPGVLSNDYDPDGDTLTASLKEQAAHGTVTLAANGSFSYLPDADWSGTDSFKYQVRDGAIDSTPVTVTIRVAPVNDAPVALSQGIETAEDSAKTLVLGGADAESEALTYTVKTQPANGTLSGAAPNLTYTPNANYNGTDSFTFEVKDSALDSAPATISIQISGVNDAPAAAAQTVSTDEDTPKTLTLSGSDVDGDALTVSVETQPAHGTLSGAAPNFTYTPAANFSGADSFTFKTSDGTLFSPAATVSISIAAQNDAPVVNNSAATTSEDTAKSIAFIATDIDGDTLTYSIVTPPTKGVLSGSGANRVYTPSANANGIDSFVWRASDGTLSSDATVSLTISPVNDAPTASAQSVSTPRNTAKTITLAGADVDGDALTFIVVTNPTKGTLTGTGANRTYTPTANYSGADSFTFKTRDSAGLESGLATVSISVTVPASPIEINYVITSQSSSGFTADIQIKNNGPVINGWTLTWDFAGNQRITNLWRGQVTQNGQSVSVKDLNYNKKIVTGATETIGFQATYSGTNAKPIAFKLNGVATAIK
ncbi:MAG TPA: Ig-like domain-containing protein [Abditibacterium sp.]